jgi:hypothetical protein
VLAASSLRSACSSAGPDHVASHVPDPADLIPSYPTEPDEVSLKATENERQRANHNPRVGGSSPSSGIEEAAPTATTR